jgi:SepF-like predicted cell division protein (DUF552 family)
MGLMSTILGEQGDSRRKEDYVSLSADGLSMEEAAAGTNIHFARIGEKTDVIEIKDAIYDGDIVIADVTRHSTQDRTMQHIVDELQQVVDEVDGDIAQKKPDDQIIVAPTGVRINRERLGK